MLITSMWYTTSEQPGRCYVLFLADTCAAAISFWYTFNGVGVGIGGLIGYGIGQIKGSLPSWRYE